MAKKIDPSLQILLGLALGGAQGFLRRKDQKRKEKREDEQFALEKQNAESRNKIAGQQYLTLKKAYDDSVAAGNVYTPEEKALIEETMDMYASQSAGATAGIKQKELANYDDDRTFERRKGEKNMQYVDWQMSRPVGGSGRAGSDDPLRDPEYRRNREAVATQEKRVRMLENALDGEDAGTPGYQQIKQQLNAERSRLDGMYDALQGGMGYETPGANQSKGEHPLSKLSEEKIKAAQGKPKGPASAFQDIKDKPMAERSIAEQGVNVLGSIGEALISGPKNLFKTVVPDVGQDYEITETEQPVDVSDRPREWIEEAERSGVIRKRQRQMPGAQGYMVGVAP